MSDANPVGKWLHFAHTYTAGTLKYYFNGAYIGSLSGTIAQSGFRLGNQGSSAATAFAGYINDFRIYSRVLSASEVTVLAGASTITSIGSTYPSISTTNMAANYKFDGDFLDSTNNLVLTVAVLDY